MTAPVAWTQTFADAYAFNNGDMADAFLKSVMRPSMHTLNERHASMLASTDPTIFSMAAYDHYQLMTHANMSFCLAIHSLWEHQIRNYLIQVVQHLQMAKPTMSQLQKADWPKLVQHFNDVKGIDLTQFDSYERLCTLQLLGNACRHGDGGSQRTLFGKCPELWPEESKLLWTGPVPSMQLIRIPDEFVARLVDAIVLFWIDMRILSFEYLVQQSSSFADQLAALKVERVARL